MFRKSVFNALKYEIKADIMQAIEGSREIREEIAKVFNVANKRLKRIQSSGVISPAVMSLGGADHFSLKGFSNYDNPEMFGKNSKSFTQLKREYARAVAFIQQPTSTLGGAKDYEKNLQSRLDLTEEQFTGMKDRLTQGITNSVGAILSQLPYKFLTEEIYDTAEDVSDQIEEESQRIEEQLTNDIEKIGDEIGGEIAETINKLINDFGFEI